VAETSVKSIHTFGGLL